MIADNKKDGMMAILQSKQITEKCKVGDVLDVMLIFNNKNGAKPFRVDATAQVVEVDTGGHAIQFVNEPTEASE